MQATHGRLVLTRKANESIIVGDNVRITITRTTGATTQLAIEAPRDVRILRAELEAREDER